MAIAQLLGDLPASAFIEDYFLRLPFTMPDRARHLLPLGTWEAVETILSRPGADVLAACEGKLWEGARQGATAPTIAQARDLYASGYTVLIRHAERQHSALAELAADFNKDFDAPINIHVYCTPARSHGFGWHYDAEDVFIIQTQGTKEYALRKNTVHPLPLAETIPADMAFEREVTPTFECTLIAGDWLYIPAGTWHMARAAEDSISLAVGVLPACAIETFDHLRGDLLASPLWRQRLPSRGAASSLNEVDVRRRYETLIHDLAEDLASRMKEERFVLSFLAKNRNQGSPGAGS